jgi:uncharacterized protein
MKAPLNALVISLLCLAALVGPNAWGETPPDALGGAELAKERQEVAVWKAGRLASLASESGWLALSGLFWLEPGENTFGSNSTNALHLDNASLAAEAGTFVLEDGTVRFIARADSGVTHEGKAVADIDLAADSTGDPTLLASGTLSFYLIERVGNFGIRVRDSANPLRASFRGLDYFPINDGWVVDARFEPYEPHKKIPIVNILSMREDMDAPGALVFAHGGQEYRLDALLEDPASTELFIMFADATSGHETYGAGRFMYVPLPHDGVVRLNFNRAYNPPCAFNDFATCPLPPPQNRLPVRVDAGELTYVGTHGDRHGRVGDDSRRRSNDVPQARHRR